MKEKGERVRVLNEGRKGGREDSDQNRLFGEEVFYFCKKLAFIKPDFI